MMMNKDSVCVCTHTLGSHDIVRSKYIFDPNKVCIRCRICKIECSGRSDKIPLVVIFGLFSE